MSTTVSYKGSTIATVNNNTKTLNTAGKYVEANIILTDVTATQHTIHLEFTDSTDTDIPVYYNDSLLDTIITAYEPSTWIYDNKTVLSAALDNTTWYDVSITYETLFNDTINYFPESNGDYPYCWISYLGDVVIPLGSIWRVTFNGTEYVLTAKYASISGVNAVIIGNPYWGEGTDDGSGVPFYFVAYTSYGAWTGNADLSNTGATASVKIERAITT